MFTEDKTLIEIKKMLTGYPFIEQILENIKQIIWLMDMDRETILYVSPAFERVWGRSCESLYADPSTLIQSVHPEDRIKFMSASPDDMRKSMDQTYRIIRPDGGLRWISAHTFQLGGEAPEPVYMVCIAEDITAQNQVDLDLRKALDRSREQFTLSRRMSLAHNPDAVLKALMSAAELRRAERAFILFFESPIYGPSREIELIASWNSNQPLSGLNSDENTFETAFFEDMVSINLFHPSKPMIVNDISKDQRLTLTVRDFLVIKHIHTIAIFPLVELGNWLGCLVVFYGHEKHFDSVELRHIKVLVDQATITLYNLQLLEKEEESRHEAERANEIKTRFLAMISHELRTPLTSIKGFTTTLLAEDVAWEAVEQRDFILTIQQEANRLQELIDQLLDLSRLEAGMLPITMEQHTLQEIILDVLPQFQVMTLEHHLSLKIPDNLPPIYVDAKRIAQVLVNLVHNAVLYTPKTTEITLTARVFGRFMQVNVIDQGPGIPQGDRKRVFQAFRRGTNEENNLNKGAGLGLAICKGLVEAHGGRIWIKKKSGPGTTISFSMPLFPMNPPRSQGKD